MNDTLANETLATEPVEAICGTAEESSATPSADHNVTHTGIAIEDVNGTPHRDDNDDDQQSKKKVITKTKAIKKVKQPKQKREKAGKQVAEAAKEDVAASGEGQEGAANPQLAIDTTAMDIDEEQKQQSQQLKCPHCDQEFAPSRTSLADLVKAREQRPGSSRFKRFAEAALLQQKQAELDSSHKMT